MWYSFHHQEVIKQHRTVMLNQVTCMISEHSRNSETSEITKAIFSMPGELWKSLGFILKVVQKD